MTIPSISVVLPVYNAERFLPEALDSVLAQTFDAFELIAVNDGSTDRSLEILTAYAQRDQRIRIITRPNTGVAGAANDGIAAARGEFLVRLDADDIALPDRFRRQYDFLRAHSDIGVVGAAYQAIDESGNYVGRPNVFPCQPDAVRRALHGGKCVLAQPATMMRLSAARRVGPYRRLFIPAEDYDLWLRMSEFAELANLPDVLLLYRLHDSSLSMKQAFRQALGAEIAWRAGRMRRRGQDDPVDDENTVTQVLLDRVGLSAADLDLMRGNTFRRLASNQLAMGNLSACLAVIDEYDAAEVAPWVRKRLLPEFELLQARIRRARGNPTALWFGAADICLRHPLFALEIIAKVIRRLRR